MSDEDRDVDIESDEDDDGTTPSETGTEFMTQAEKRAHHNALERKRRDHIKESFHSLRDSVPELHAEKVQAKASRAQILKQATDYIQFMTKKNNTHQYDIEDLKRQNGTLESQVRSLEKAKAAGTFAAAQSLDGASSSGKGTKHYDGGSGSESSDSEATGKKRRKKLKT
jgi:Max protein